MAAYPPLTCSLPWEKLNGKVQTHNLLVRWTDDRFIRARVYSELIWKPALVAAGVIPASTKDANSRTRFTTSHKEGLHQLRHLYASVTLAARSPSRNSPSTSATPTPVSLSVSTRT